MSLEEKKETMDWKPRPAVNTGEDKREAQHRRESSKTLLNVIAGVLIAIFSVLIGWCVTTNVREFQELLIQEKFNPIPNVQLQKDTVAIDNTGYAIVHKVSKDYRKYFVSYKVYYGKNKYHLKISEISFEQFMALEKGDTLSKAFNEILKPGNYDTSLSDDN